MGVSRGVEDGGDQLVFELLGVRHQRVVAGAVLVHAHRVDGGVAAFLHGAAAEGFQPRLGGDGEYRVAVVIRRGDAGNHVGGARPGSGEAHAELAGFPGVAVGHEGGTGLVPGDDCAIALDIAATQFHRAMGWKGTPDKPGGKKGKGARGKKKRG